MINKYLEMLMKDKNNPLVQLITSYTRPLMYYICFIVAFHTILLLLILYQITNKYSHTV